MFINRLPKPIASAAPIVKNDPTRQSFVVVMNGSLSVNLKPPTDRYSAIATSRNSTAVKIQKNNATFIYTPPFIFYIDIMENF